MHAIGVKFPGKFPDRRQAVGWRGEGAGAVVFYTPPVVVTSPGRLPIDIERLRGLLCGFFLEAIRQEERPGLDAAQERFDALYEHLRRGLNMYAEPPEEVARRQDAWRMLHDAI
jgi:hypothetical protein